ncbi:MAG TPA: hypothetical protein VJ846_09575 [Sphingomicrobium sp.]|nr:hypothetical protein [Sphingomicrobium sp.]
MRKRSAEITIQDLRAHPLSSSFFVISNRTGTTRSDEIAAASEEQSRGIEQVNQAVMAIHAVSVVR